VTPDWVLVLIATVHALTVLGLGWFLLRRLLRKTTDAFDGLRADVIAARTLPTDH
jgi:hypothetical protein